MRRQAWMLAGMTLVFGVLVLIHLPVALGQQIVQNGFEGRNTYWKPGSSDAVARVIEHRLTEETAHGGQRSEHLRLQVEKGTFIHYTLDLPKALVNDELHVGLWIKSNRPKIQLLCRMVFPRERDPNHAGRPLTVLVRCEPYQSTRWKMLTLRQPVKRLQEQKQLLAHQLGRDIITTGAYIDQLVLNLYDGPGQLDVWIDDLEIGPVEQNQPITPPADTVASIQPKRRNAEVQLRGNHLWVSGSRFFLRGIRHTGLPPLQTVREAGFNTVWLDESTPPALIEEATNQGFWVVPAIVPRRKLAQPSGRVEGTLTANNDLGQKVSRFLDQNSVLAWDLGSNLGAERFADVASLARTFRTVDPQRPVLADVWDGFRGYSRSLDQVMLGTHRWPLMTSLEMSSYREWLDMRRRLAAGGYHWTWIQTHLPDWFLKLLDEDPSTFKEPVGPLPEQIRLLTYHAIAAGYRGLAFWSDRYLADSHQGKDRLLGMALLNQELMLLERILVNAVREPEWISTSRPEVMAAVFYAPEGVLVLPIWIGGGSQYVPGQAAVADLSITVPGVPITTTAWEVSPGRIQMYPVRREIGGTSIKLRNFSLTSAILFTSDLSPSGLVVRLQGEQRKMGRLAAQWLHDQAREELAKIEKVHVELERLGHTFPDAQALLNRARQSLDRCMQHRRNREHGAAYAEAEVALRSLRVLMRTHWDRAVRDLDSPVASPFAVSFYTLPRHWLMLDRLKGLRPSASVLPGGDFEQTSPAEQVGWLVQEVPTLDDVHIRVQRTENQAHAGKRSLMLQVIPKDPKYAPVALERTYVALHSPAVKLEPGSLVRISTWMKVPAPIRGSMDGALFFDSVGGEPLAVRQVNPTGKWKKVTLYRKVPASGRIHVTLGMSGMGTVYFDDVRIEPLVPAVTAAVR
jgi:hypothetical protein